MTTNTTTYTTVRRAAELAGVSHWTIRRWIKRGRLQAKQRSGEHGHLLIDTTSLKALLEQTVNG